MSRKGENIYKRKDGRWEGRYISSYCETGTAKYKYVYAKTYTEVKNKLHQERAKTKLNTHEVSCRSDKKYECWLDEWLKSKKDIVKQSTYIRYSNMIKTHIKPTLGNYIISRISTEIIEQFLAYELNEGRIDNNGGLSPKTVSDLFVIVKESFLYAQKHGEIVNCRFERSTLKKHNHEMRVLNQTEEERLIKVLTTSEDRCKLGVLICLCTGIRIGELCALQWKNISFSEKTLRIECTMQRLQYENMDYIAKTHVIISEPKSFAALRTIPLPDFLLERMKPYYESPNAFLLSGECNRYIEPRTMQNRFKTYLAESRIDDANFHALRHTFATRCVEIGFDIKTLSEILGHSSVKITLDKYVHSSLELKRNNMEKLQYMVQNSCL